MPVIEIVQKIWVPEVPDIELPDEDGEPLESNWHQLQINLLGDALDQHWQGRTDFFAGGNMFVYYSLEQARNRDYRGPDFFVVKFEASGALVPTSGEVAAAERARAEAMEAENARLRAELERLRHT